VEALGAIEEAVFGLEKEGAIHENYCPEIWWHIAE